MAPQVCEPGVIDGATTIVGIGVLLIEPLDGLGSGQVIKMAV